MQEIGRRTWVIADGWVPPRSSGEDPSLVSHEAACILNAGNRDAHVRFTIFFSDAEPSAAAEIVVPARRIRHQNLEQLPELSLPKGTDYCVLMQSDEPIVVQHTRLDSRQAANALMTTIAFSVE